MANYILETQLYRHAVAPLLSWRRWDAGVDPTLIVTRRGASFKPSRRLFPVFSTRTLPPRFMRLACPAVKLRSPLNWGGEQTSGGLFRRSRLPRRVLEMPFVLLAKAAGMLGRGIERSGMAEIEETRRPVAPTGPPRALGRRAFADCMALRILRASMILESESEPELGVP